MDPLRFMFGPIPAAAAAAAKQPPPQALPSNNNNEEEEDPEAAAQQLSAGTGAGAVTTIAAATDPTIAATAATTRTQPPSAVVYYGNDDDDNNNNDTDDWSWQGDDYSHGDHEYDAEENTWLDGDGDNDDVSDGNDHSSHTHLIPYDDDNDEVSSTSAHSRGAAPPPPPPLSERPGLFRFLGVAPWAPPPPPPPSSTTTAAAAAIPQSAARSMNDTPPPLNLHQSQATAKTQASAGVDNGVGRLSKPSAGSSDGNNTTLGRSVPKDGPDERRSSCKGISVLTQEQLQQTKLAQVEADVDFALYLLQETTKDEAVPAGSTLRSGNDSAGHAAAAGAGAVVVNPTDTFTAAAATDHAMLSLSDPTSDFLFLSKSFDSDDAVSLMMKSNHNVDDPTTIDSPPAKETISSSRLRIPPIPKPPVEKKAEKSHNSDKKVRIQIPVDDSSNSLELDECVAGNDLKLKVDDDVVKKKYETTTARRESVEKTLQSIEKFFPELAQSRSQAMDLSDPTPSGPVVDRSPPADPEPSVGQKAGLDRLLVVTAVYILPFTYKSGSQLPYVYFLLELVEVYEVSLNLAGVFLAMTFVCRLTTLAYCVRAPRKSAILGTIAALLGYISMAGASAVSSDQKMTASILFVAGNVVVGFGEVNGSLQIFIKELFALGHAEDLKVVSKYLKTQLSVMNVSTVTTYALGGWIYDSLGGGGVSAFGALLLLLQLGGVIFLMYLERATGRKGSSTPSFAIDAASAAIEAKINADELAHSAEIQRVSVPGHALAAAAATAHGYRRPGENRDMSLLSATIRRNYITDIEYSSSSSEMNLAGNDSMQSIAEGIELSTIFEHDSEEYGTAEKAEGNATGQNTESPRITLRATKNAADTGAFPCRQDGMSDSNSDKYGYNDQRSAPSTPHKAAGGVGRRMSRMDLIKQRRASSRDLAQQSQNQPRPTSALGGQNQLVRERPSELIGRYSTVADIPISWINYFVAFAVSFQSILNGFVFSTGTLLMFQEYGLSKSEIGIIYSCSAVTGVLSSLLALNERFIGLIRRTLPSPHNFYFFLFGCTYMTILTAIPNFVSFLVGFMSVNVTLGLFVCYLTEMQGKISTTENYQKLAPYGQIARRVSGLIIIFITPSLYNVLPRLPNIVGSCVSFLTTVIIFIGFESASTRTREELTAILGAENVRQHGSTLIIRTESETGQPQSHRRMTFSDQIVMSSMFRRIEQSAESENETDPVETQIQINYAQRESLIYSSM